MTTFSEASPSITGASSLDQFFTLSPCFRSHLSSTNAKRWICNSEDWVVFDISDLSLRQAAVRKPGIEYGK